MINYLEHLHTIYFYHSFDVKLALPIIRSPPWYTFTAKPFLHGSNFHGSEMCKIILDFSASSNFIWLYQQNKILPDGSLYDVDDMIVDLRITKNYTHSSYIRRHLLQCKKH